MRVTPTAGGDDEPGPLGSGGALPVEDDGGHAGAGDARPVSLLGLRTPERPMVRRPSSRARAAATGPGTAAGRQMSAGGDRASVVPPPTAATGIERPSPVTGTPPPEAPPAPAGWIPDVDSVPRPTAAPRGPFWRHLEPDPALVAPPAQAPARGPAATTVPADAPHPVIPWQAPAAVPPAPTDLSGPPGEVLAPAEAPPADAAAGVDTVSAGATGGPAAPARVWFFGYGPPPPPFPPPGEEPRARRTVPVVYTPPPRPATAPGPVPPAPRPAPVPAARPEPATVGGVPPARPVYQALDRLPAAQGDRADYAQAWWRGLELAGRGVLAPVPPTRIDGRRVLVGGFGGGSGRTTVAVGLGLALAARRGGRVVALDACPDQGGPLADRAGVPGRGVGLRELVTAIPPVAALAEARRFLATAAPCGLEVLPGLRDLTAPGLTPAEVAWAVDLLERLFPAVVIDGPPGWTQPVPAVLLARADTVVVTARAPQPGEPSAAGCAQDALTALAAARPDLPAGAVVAVVETTPTPRVASWRRPADGPAVDLVEPVHAVVTIPYDPALCAGPIRPDRLRPRTREAFAQLARIVDEAPLGVAGPAPGAAEGPGHAGGPGGACP